MVGGGLVGLAAAWRLASAGVGVTVVDGSARWGGVLAGGGSGADLVAHRLPAPAVGPLAGMPTLAGRVRPVVAVDRVLVDGRWSDAPVPARRPVGEALRAAVACKLWGRAEAALEPEGVTAGLEALGLVDPDGPVNPLRRPAPRTCWHLDGGLARLTEALVDAIAGAGGELRLGCTVDGVRPDGDVVHVHTDDGAIVTVRQVVLSVPLVNTVSLLRDVPPGVRNAVAAQRWRSLLTVLLEVPRTLAGDLDGRWFAGGDTPIWRLAVVDPIARGPTAMLSVELVVTRDDPLWLAPDEQLVALVGDHLVRARLPDLAPCTAEVHRLADLLPVPRRGGERHRAVIDAWLASEPLLTVPPGGPLVPHLEVHRLLAAGDAAGASALAQLAVSSAMA